MWAGIEEGGISAIGGGGSSIGCLGSDLGGGFDFFLEILGLMVVLEVFNMVVEGLALVLDFSAEKRAANPAAEGGGGGGGFIVGVAEI